MSVSRIALLLLLVFALQASGAAALCLPHPCCRVQPEDCATMQMDAADCPMCDEAAKAPQPAIAQQPVVKWTLGPIAVEIADVVGFARNESFSPASKMADR